MSNTSIHGLRWMSSQGNRRFSPRGKEHGRCFIEGDSVDPGQECSDACAQENESFLCVTAFLLCQMVWHCCLGLKALFCVERWKSVL